MSVYFFRILWEWAWPDEEDDESEDAADADAASDADVESSGALLLRNGEVDGEALLLEFENTVDVEECVGDDDGE